MELDRFALYLRQRDPWEAMDLGCAMLRCWWRPALLAWFAVYLPVGAVVCVVLREQLFLAVLTLWWLKPLFDRAVLHVLGGAVFGDAPGAWATLRALPGTPGLLASLTLYRFDLARSFDLPVWHLERLRGGEARARARVLHRRARGHAVWLTVGYMLFELTVIISLFGLIDLLTPELYERRFGWAAMFWGAEDAQWKQWLYIALYAGAVSMIEPLYVAAGFALYLNRRTQLEAWDVELALRRLEERSAPATRVRAATAAAALALLVALAWPPTAPRAAQAAQPGAAEQIREVLKEPAFDQHREVKSWRYTGPGLSWDNDEKPKGNSNVDWENLGRFLAELARALMWGLSGALLAAAIYYLARYWPRWRRDATPEKFTPPAVLFGMDIRPESLPRDISGAATALIETGAVREALSLLYRGTLSVLVHRERLALGTGDTEHDCLRKARTRCPAQIVAYFARLVAAWQGAAYAARVPERAAALELCAGWRTLFATDAP